VVGLRRYQSASTAVREPTITNKDLDCCLGLELYGSMVVCEDQPVRVADVGAKAKLPHSPHAHRGVTVRRPVLLPYIGNGGNLKWASEHDRLW
jgi:hypothetical protein